MRIWFEDFAHSNIQLSLFNSPPDHAGKKAIIMQAMDQIRDHYGEEIIRYGRTAPYPC